MAARGLLYHPLHTRPPSRAADPRYRLPRRFFSCSDGFTATPRHSLSLSPAFRSVQCVTPDNGAGKVGARVFPRAELDSNGSKLDLVEWVNKAAPGPMVEVDPVTVFRRIIAERTASLAMARAKKQKEGGMVTIQSTAPAPFFLGNKLPGKSIVAIAVALVFLALAAASYFLRSKRDGKKQIELNLAEGKKNPDVPTDDTCKLVKDTIQAPESVLTAMAIGAASVGRPKGHTASSHDIPHVTNSNRVDTQKPESGAGLKPIVNTTGIMDTQNEVHGNPTFGQVSYNPNSLEGFGSFKTQSAVVDVSEGPWFSQGADDAGDLQPESKTQSTSVGQDFELENILAQRQELHLSSEVAVEKIVAEISVSDVRFEAPSLNNVVDGEFLGELATISVATEEAVKVSHSKIENYKYEEPEDDGLLADSSAIVEKLEQMIGQESISSMEGKGVVGEIRDLEEEKLVDVKQSLTPLSHGASVESSDSEGDDGCQGTGPLDVEDHGDMAELLSGVDKILERIEEPQTCINRIEEPQVAIQITEEPQTAFQTYGEPQTAIQTMEEPRTAIQAFEEPLAAIQSYEEPQAAIQVIEEPQTAIQSLEEPQTAIQTIEEPQTGIETFNEPQTAIQAVEDLQQTDASLSVNQYTHQSSDAFANDSPADAALQSSEEDPRLENAKALEAALPALAIGVGTVGTLFGVAGGLQVVGFAALASFLSQDFFWAERREELWQQVKGITDRQKLLDFLARRNILKKDGEESSL